LNVNPLKEWRESKKLSVDRIAQSVSVTRQIVYAWESGASCPNKQNMALLAHIMDITAEALAHLWVTWEYAEDRQASKT